MYTTGDERGVPPGFALRAAMPRSDRQRSKDEYTVQGQEILVLEETFYFPPTTGLVFLCRPRCTPCRDREALCRLAWQHS
ncbi:hypothetical protein E2C01_088335 [Portunus trituberculatus]|uniref:Uncharacterized protein n=1 Tax=Portunus trituberculatus TaxID=210409 RepID=A0A5B7JAG8_PORTR|nr:hypothetical protein [Portunus trituberculatus]